MDRRQDAHRSAESLNRATFVLPILIENDSTHTVALLAFCSRLTCKVYETRITTWPLHVLVILATLLTFITIFLFKRRALQIRLSAVSIVLDLGLMGMAYFYYHQVANGISDGLASLSMLYLLPFIAAILTFLGILGVKKDIAILRSLSRL